MFGPGQFVAYDDYSRDDMSRPGHAFVTGAGTPTDRAGNRSIQPHGRNPYQPIEGQIEQSEMPARRKTLHLEKCHGRHFFEVS